MLPEFGKYFPFLKFLEQKISVFLVGPWVIAFYGSNRVAVDPLHFAVVSFAHFYCITLLARTGDNANITSPLITEAGMILLLCTYFGTSHCEHYAGYTELHATAQIGYIDLNIKCMFKVWVAEYLLHMFFLGPVYCP